MNKQTIYYFTPQGSESWGESMNRHCAIVPNDEDWICMVEADCMMFPAKWAEEVEWAVASHPEVDVFTAYATRTKRKSEAMYDAERMGERDLVRLYDTAMECWDKNRGRIRIRQQSPAGFFYVFRKKLWMEVPFASRGGDGQMNLHMDILWGKALRSAGKTIANIEALCCVHFYRLNDPDMSDEHLR